jgi:urate oxidase
MPAKLTSDSYGKSAVRLTKIKRLPDRHELIELEVSIELTGDFAGSYLTGDNRQIIATDTMKNTVYALAARHPLDAVEDFALALATHFVERNAHVASATIDLAQTAWKRIAEAGRDHPHAFVGAGDHRRTARVLLTRTGPQISAGVENLLLLKTTDSAFKDFLRDEYTTLPDTADRIFATRLTAQWTYSPGPHDWNVSYDATLSAMLRTFAHHKSLAVQQTLHAMGESALDTTHGITSIDLEMPNQHRIPFNLEPLGLPNQNEIFITTSEPYGLIKASLART